MNEGNQHPEYVGSELTHYTINQAEQRKKHSSNADFGSAVLCGNGSYHAKGTRDKSRVTCPSCLSILADKPPYLIT